MSPAMTTLSKTLAFEPAVSLFNGVRVDRQLDGDFPHGG
jgi:hypothetical protein